MVARIRSVQNEPLEEERPLPAYLALVALYNAVVAAGLLVAHRTGRKVPDRVPLLDLLLLGVATFKLSRIISRAKVTSALRSPLTEFEQPIADGEVMERPTGSGIRKAIGELVLCPFCIAQWIGTCLYGGLLFAPSYTRFIASLFVSVTVSDFFQYFREAIRKKADE